MSSDGYTKVRLDICCEGVAIDDGSTMYSSSVLFVIDLPCLGFLSPGAWEEGPLRDTVGINCEKGPTTEHNALVPHKCAHGWLLDDFICVICLGMTRVRMVMLNPLGGFAHICTNFAYST